MHAGRWEWILAVGRAVLRYALGWHGCSENLLGGGPAVFRALLLHGVDRRGDGVSVGTRSHGSSTSSKESELEVARVSSRASASSPGPSSCHPNSARRRRWGAPICGWAPSVAGRFGRNLRRGRLWGPGTEGAVVAQAHTAVMQERLPRKFLVMKSSCWSRPFERVWFRNACQSRLDSLVSWVASVPLLVPECLLVGHPPPTAPPVSTRHDSAAPPRATDGTPAVRQ